MAELTPPPSQNNTPLRPSESEDTRSAPSSPTQGRAPHPLSTSSQSGAMDLDSAALTSASASASRSPATPSPEPEMGNSIFNDVPPPSSRIAAEEEDGMDDTDEEETVLVEEPEVTGKGKGKREPEARGPGRKIPRSNAKGRKEGKESDLYESDIVARWNRDFGDVCALPKTA